MAKVKTPMMKKLASALGIVGFGLFMLIALTGRGKGFVYSLFWDGQSPLVCGGSFVMNIKDKKIEMPAGSVFDVGGDCELTVENCDIKAPVVLSGGGNARVIFKGGRIEGTENVFRVGGDLQVKIEGTQIVGPISSGGNAHIEGLPANDPRIANQVPPQMKKALDAASAVLCAGVTNCYDQVGEFGQISGHLALQMSDDGRVTKVGYSAGQASAKVQKCLFAMMKKRRVNNYSLGAGEFSCDYAGTFIRGTSMMSSSSSFRKSN